MSGKIDMTKDAFVLLINDWYSKNKKYFNFPWRETRDPYRIFVSEIMLQQTQISRVLPKYEEWLQKFPTLGSLANAPFPKVLKVWQGMGYNRRARYLKDIAEIVVRKYNGQIPRDPRTLETLPGIGHYTARAICCFAYGAREPFLETNIRRTLIHFFFDNAKKEKISDEELLNILSRVEPKTKKRDLSACLTASVCLCVACLCVTRRQARRQVLAQAGVHAQAEWYYALMDYGREALGKISDNPNRRAKNYRAQSKFLGSRRYVRAKIISYLVSKRNGVNRKELLNVLKKDLHAKDFLTPHVFDRILIGLSRDKLITRKANNWMIFP